MFRKPLLATALGCAVFATGSTVDAQVRLIGMTGNHPSQVDPNVTAQLSLFEIDYTDGSSTLLHRFGQGFDSQSIGFNAADGMLYHTSGINSWRPNDPNHYAFNDTHYMEKMDPADLLPNTQITTIPVFNADPLGRPQPAPRPDWVYPPEPRVLPTDPVNDPEGDATNNEYHSMRGMAWSESRGLFYGSDEEGIFTMTPDGQSTFVGIPRPDFDESKGIAFVEVNGEERLYIATKGTTGQVGDSPAAELIQIDPATGLEISAIPLIDWFTPDLGISGITALSVHPETGVLYGIGKGVAEIPATNRELLIIDPVTGETTLVGNVATPELGLNIASMAFVWDVEPPVGQPGDTNNDGTVDLEDLNAVRNNFGGTGAVGSTPGDAYPFDGVVDLEDLNGVRNNFGAGPGGAVPEPSTVVLALAGLAVVGYRFRRK
jgi:hypothetical protein